MLTCRDASESPAVLNNALLMTIEVLHPPRSIKLSKVHLPCLITSARQNETQGSDEEFDQIEVKEPSRQFKRLRQKPASQWNSTLVPPTFVAQESATRLPLRAKPANVTIQDIDADRKAPMTEERKLRHRDAAATSRCEAGLTFKSDTGKAFDLAVAQAHPTGKSDTKSREEYKAAKLVTAFKRCNPADGMIIDEEGEAQAAPDSQVHAEEDIRIDNASVVVRADWKPRSENIREHSLVIDEVPYSRYILQHYHGDILVGFDGKKIKVSWPKLSLIQQQHFLDVCRLCPYTGIWWPKAVSGLTSTHAHKNIARRLYEMTFDSLPKNREAAIMDRMKANPDYVPPPPLAETTTRVIKELHHVLDPCTNRYNSIHRLTEVRPAQILVACNLWTGNSHRVFLSGSNRVADTTCVCRLSDQIHSMVVSNLSSSPISH
jgi:hypothetical protein